MASQNVKHSSKSDRWYTPLPILHLVREVLGTIDLDPASEPDANTRVGAKKIYTKDDNGLFLPWNGNIFCNPPGGVLEGRSLAGLFWQKLMAHKPVGRAADFRHAVFLCFSIEALQSTQKPDQSSVGDYTFCVPSKRIRFDGPVDAVASASSGARHGKPGTSPSHGNLIVYVPGQVNESKKFADVFRTLGVICNE